MIVDCADCKVRDIACADCVVTVLLGLPGRPTSEGFAPGSRATKIRIDQDELGAMDVLAEVGLIPRLRLVVGGDSQSAGASLSTRDTDGDMRAG